MMASKSERIPCLVLDRTQLECLSSPKRSDILSVMRSRNSVSVKEIALELGESPETVHYHMKALLGAGIVRVVGEQLAGRRFERLFDRSAETYRFDPESNDPEYRRLIRKTVSRIVKVSESEYLSCSEAADHDPAFLGGALARRFNARLTPKAIDELRHRFAAVLDWAREQDDENGVRLAGLVTFSPLVKKKSERRGKTSLKTP